MIKKAGAPPRANLSPEQMQSAVKLLDRRADELTRFDVTQIVDHGDQNAETLRIKYNKAIADIFGPDTYE